jgi:DNA repair photolyase
MRSILEVLERTSHPVGIVTKSALVLRDIDILSRMAARGLAHVALSVTTLDRRLARVMEPRAATPAKRVEAIRLLSEAGIPATAMVAPVIPAINDNEIETILETVRDAGAVSAGYVLLRLPLEIKQLFREWLATEFPDRTEHVIHLMQSMHGGRDYNSDWGVPTGQEAAWLQRGSRAIADRPLRSARARGATNAVFLKVFQSPLPCRL